MKTTLCLSLTLLTLVTLAFVPKIFAQDSRPIVRLIYFVPSDRQPQPDIDTKMDKLIKDVQQGYEGIMEAHGFGKKTFRFETDANENAVVHTVNGQYTEKYYNVPLNVEHILKEIDEQFDSSKNFYLIAIDISSELLGGNGGIAGTASPRGGSAGWALMPASGPYFNIILAAHELGHAFGLPHDYRPDVEWVKSDIVVYQHPFYATFCAAEWLDVHRAFNAEQPASNVEPTFDMLPPSFVSSPNVIRLRFKVTDHDGIHQVQLMTPERDRTGALLGCKKLNGNSSATVEFVTSSLTPQSGSVSLQMIDGHGNISWSGGYPIDFSSLLPPSAAISIPDPNLASAVREKLGLASGVPITQVDMVRLRYLVVEQREITNLTGLEHATQLQDLYVTGNQIMDITPLSKLKYLRELNILSNQIADITPLSKLEYLRELIISGNQISDLTPLKDLTNLRRLFMSDNPIRDITVLPSLKNLELLNIGNNPINDMSPVWELTQLQQLGIRSMKIRDLSPLTKFTKLHLLQLDYNQVSDISPLAGLTNLTILLIGFNQISDISPLTGLTKLEELSLLHNQITDVRPIAGLLNLRLLSLKGNPIEDFSPLRTLIANNPGLKIDIDVPDPPPLAFSPDTIADQTFEVGRTIQALTLPKAIGGTTPYTYNISGLPAGLQFDTATRLLSGTPTTITPSTSVTYTATDATGTSASLTFTITVQDKPTFNPSVIADQTFTVGEAVNLTLPIATGGTAPYTYTLAPLPGGLSFSATERELSGTPTTVGTTTATYTTTDAASVSASLTFTMDVILDLDVNGDGQVTVIDLAIVALFYRTQVPIGISLPADVNTDGMVDILDLTAVAQAIDTTGGNQLSVKEVELAVLIAAAQAAELEAAAGAPIRIGSPGAAAFLSNHFAAKNVAAALAAVRKDVRLRKEIPAVLETFLALLSEMTVVPETTALLPNYPNPFNPETWIPYQLAKPTEVTITIYAINRQVVRQLALGHQAAGLYQTGSRAAYWDGKNAFGEPVASGVYFYTLTAGKFTATRKMLIQK